MSCYARLRRAKRTDILQVKDRTDKQGHRRVVSSFGVWMVGPNVNEQGTLALFRHLKGLFAVLANIDTPKNLVGPLTLLFEDAALL